MSKLDDFIKDNQIVQYGQFQLASGKASNMYVDAKKITLDSRIAYAAATELLDAMHAVSYFEAVGGLCIGADPIIGAMVAITGFWDEEPPSGLTPIKGFLIRKEPKGHGLKKFIEGPVEPRMRVAIVEDVITTGKSVVQAIERAQDFGLDVRVVGAIINRQEGAEELLDKMNIPLVYLRKISDLVK